MSDVRTIYVVDDGLSARRSLRVLLESAGFAVKDYASAREFLADEDKSGDCLIADYLMPEMDGLELKGRVDELELGLPVIIITGSGDVPLAVRAMRAGAVDFLEKPFKAEDLFAVLERALEIADRRRPRAIEARHARELIARLTPRERQVLAELAVGRSNKSAAHKLSISPRTIEIHRARIMRKLNARSMSDLMKTALAASLLETEPSNVEQRVKRES